MTQSFHVYLRRNFEVRNTVNFLEKVYQKYEGKLFLPESIRINNKERILQKLIFTDIISELNEDVCRISLQFKNVNARLYINFKGYDSEIKGFKNEYRVSFNPPFNIYFDENLLNEIINFAIALMKAQDESLFVGGPEIGFPEEAPQKVWIIGYKEKNKLLEYLNKHIKYNFQIDLNKNEIEKILQQTTQLKRIKGVNVLFLADLDEWKKDPDNYEILFYKQIKNLKNATKN